MYERDWSDQQLELGKPYLMDTATLIEWIQRQLEHPNQTKIRHLKLDTAHKEWHESNPGIYACCVRGTQPRLFTTNERRSMYRRGRQSEELLQQALNAFKDYNGKPVVLDSSINVTQHMLY